MFANLNKTKSLLFSLLLIVFSCSNLTKEHKILGYWEGSINNNKLLFVFNNDGMCRLKFFNDQSSSPMKIGGTYELDYSKKPISLSIRNIPQLTYSLHTIIEFI